MRSLCVPAVMTTRLSVLDFTVTSAYRIQRLVVRLPYFWRHLTAKIATPIAVVLHMRVLSANRAPVVDDIAPITARSDRGSS